MTTPLTAEPTAANALVPYMTELVDRLYERLPEHYRVADRVNLEWVLKRYLGGALHLGGQVADTVEDIAGNAPVGPATPEPWGLIAEDLQAWRAARVNQSSMLGDPVAAPAAWLPWMAQLVGARLDSAASEMEQRDTVRYATSGWRAGSRQAIADAAKTALTGEKHAEIHPHQIPAGGGGLTPGTIWDITIVTKAEETPDAGAVLGAIERKGVRPAGTVLHHASFTASWDAIEANFPTWDDIDATNWTGLESAE